MERDRRLSLVVGTFVLGILAVFAGVVLSLSAERGFWKPRYPLVAYFDNVQGLIAGAPVRLAGKDVGTVESVRFGPLGGDRPPIRVSLQIDRSVQERIRSDSFASIGTIGLLGDKYVEISMGTLDGSVLAEGREVPARTPLDLPDLVAKGTTALDGIVELSSNVNQVVEDFGVRMGGKRIAESVAAVTELVTEIQQGEGLLHSLIYDRYEGGGVQNIERALAAFEDILDQVRHGPGLLHTVIYDPAGADEDLILEAIQAGARLNSILVKVDQGEGTLGLLVNDPTLYEDLKVLVGGAQRSLLIRSLLKLAGDDQ
jgi:phospholipid/cholesterol/gamma-HCH transport system substrate-binding protein